MSVMASIHLVAGSSTMSFAVKDGRLHLLGVAGFPKKGQTSPWRLSLQRSDGAHANVEADSARLTTAQPTHDGALFEWHVNLGDGSAEVRMRVRLDPNGLSRWALEVELPAGLSVTEAVFPRIRLRRAEGTRLAVPTSWGLEKQLEAGFQWDATYPSWGATMQFIAAYAAGDGVYLATHDPKANHKGFQAEADEETFTLSCSHYPAVAGGNFTLPYEVVIGGYRGGFMEAAGLYREFALSAPWAQAGPLSRRAVPQWLLDTELWLKPGETPWTDDDAACIAATQANVEWCRKAKSFFDVPISLHWYRWHKIPYDTLYPEYFPAKQGFADGVQEAQEAGFRVMPYINGRLCDADSGTWKTKAHRWAARDAAGEPYTEVYGSKVPLTPMCPATPYWQDTVSGLVKRLTDEIGVDGVYIDQIACAKAERCFDPGHPHPPGGGMFWANGYRTMLQEARPHLRPDGMLTSEECIECWMDLLDAHLVLNCPCGEGEVIPLFPAVYAGHTVTFGFQYFPPAESVHSLGFRAKMARGFLWGSQLGWIDAAKLMADGGETDREFLRNLCQTRKDAHDFLLYGQFLGPVEVTGDNPRLTAEAPGSFGGTYSLDLPAVMATAWRAEDGRTAVAVCNMDDTAHTVEMAGATLTLAAREARVIADA